MVILYGEDLDANGVADRYVRASAVTNMNNVINVRIMLLVQTLTNNLTPQPVSYTFNGTTVTPTDNYLREVVTQTLLIRNRSK